MPAVDLVADLGEGFGAYSIGDDTALLEIVSSANIACGFHAGDPDIMNATVAQCVRRGVGIGAHPSFPDLRGFGRRTMDLTADEVRNDVVYQLGALTAFARYHGGTVSHLAPHGRLGNLVATRADYAQAVADAAAGVDPALIVLAQDGELARAAADLEDASSGRYPRQGHHVVEERLRVAGTGLVVEIGHVVEGTSPPQPSCVLLFGHRCSVS